MSPCGVVIHLGAYRRRQHIQSGPDFDFELARIVRGNSAHDLVGPRSFSVSDRVQAGMESGHHRLRAAHALIVRNLRLPWGPWGDILGWLGPKS